MARHEEDQFMIPLDVFKQSAGFSIDIGQSFAKIAYVAKRSKFEVQDEWVKVHFHVVSLNAIDDVVDFILSHCKINRTSADEILTVRTTGIGINMFNKKLSDALNVRFINEPEFVATLRTIDFLKKYRPEEIFHPVCEEALANGTGKANELRQFYTNLKIQAVKEGKMQASQLPPDILEQMGMLESQTSTEDYQNRGNQINEPTPVIKAQEDVYPFMLVLCGSGSIFIKVKSKSEMDVLDIHTRTGRYFHGLGSLLTGAKTFEELLDLVARGTDKSLNTFTDDFRPEDVKPEDMYSKLPSGLIGTSFGKAPGKELDDFKKEDLAKTLLVTTVLDLTQTIFHIAMRSDLRRIFIGGLFVDNEHIRQVMTEHFAQRGIRPEEILDVRFLKYGGYLGSIGGLIPDDL